VEGKAVPVDIVAL